MQTELMNYSNQSDINRNAWSSLLVGDGGCIGPSGKLLQVNMWAKLLNPNQLTGGQPYSDT